MKKREKLTTVIAGITAVIFTFVLTLTALHPLKVFAEEEEVQLTVSSLKGSGEDSIAFAVPNMFPGDQVTETYCLEATYKSAVTVKFHADIQAGYEKLAEVLKCKVVLTKEGDAVLYDGLMKDMPASLDVDLQASGKTTEELHYVITAYLDTDVTNEYQNKSLKADFRWWVEYEPAQDSNSEGTEADGDSDNSGSGNGSAEQGVQDNADDIQSSADAETGDDSHIWMWVSLSLGLFLMTALLVAWERKEGAHENK